MPHACRLPLQNWSALVLLAAVSAGCSGTESAQPGQSASDKVSIGADAGDDKPAARTPGGAEGVGRQLERAEQELAEGNREKALQQLREIPQDGSRVSMSAARMAAQIQESLGQLSAAIASYEYILKHDPDQTGVRGHLAEIYALTGQRAEADALLRQVAKTPDLGFKQLVLLTDFERRHGDDLTMLQRLEAQAPDDPAVQLGLAVEDFERGRIDSARQRLEIAVAADPRLGTAQALLGEILLLKGASDELVQWHRHLPAQLADHSAIWYTRGLWAQQLEEPAVAARCLWESARTMPTSYRTIHQLARVLSPLDSTAGRAFAIRAEELHQLKQLLSRVLDSRGRDEAAMQNLVEMLLTSGREWEAWSWTILAQSRFPRSAWIQQTLGKLAAYPHTAAPRILDSANLALRFDLSHHPDFDSILSKLEPQVATPPSPRSAETVSFADEARQLGLTFTYHRGRTAEMEGVRMQESTGGGVGVLDYDNDGRPDLFFTQGENWPAGANKPTGSASFQDALFRNLGDRFENVTLPADLADEDGFGQGCACGDFNNDGFPDIYVANIGVNQLLINNGDGTFEDWTSRAGLSEEAWTTSCVMADLNADGNADLFDVNYVEGELLFRMTCDETECSPEVYSGSADLFRISQGDGTTFPVESRPDERVGAGLGVVVFRAGVSVSGEADSSPAPQDSHDSNQRPARLAEGEVALFVANDQDPNFFLRLVGSDDPRNVAVIDESFLAGLALNRDGNTTACMGVASGDLTGDGRIDLLVTNYKDESNTFFVQVDAGLFADSIGHSGMMFAGLPYVGWGTQALDADNDGWLDLVVTNGHVGEFSNRQAQYRMPTQFFRNRGEGRFDELSPQTLGSFFSRRLLGRSLATLDWNRDGSMDFVISLLDENVALLSNQTPDPGNWLMLRLHGTVSARDPIGTSVTVTTDQGLLRRELTGGDGYQASNERVLHFGLGPADAVRELTLEWPSGRTQTFVDVPVNTLLLVTEDGRWLSAFDPAGGGTDGPG
jgi:tetratricopeptide (TPR) repeat protein